MIGQDIAHAALEGMNLLFETFSRKGRKMPRLSLKISDKNLIKVASLNGKRQHWCSYWIVPAIPNEGPFPVPAGFRFSVNHENHFFAENTAGDHKIQLFEGDYLLVISPSIRSLLADPVESETRIWLSKGVFVANAKYFKQHWEPAESNEKTLREFIARGTLIDTESKDYKEDETIPFEGDIRKTFPLNESTLATTIVDVTKPTLAEIAICEQILRQQGRVVVDTLNPSKPMLTGLASLLMSHSYLVYKKGDEGLSDLAWVKSLLRAEGYRVITDGAHVAAQDSAYESGYHKGMQEMRRIYDVDKRFALRAYEVGFEAGRMVEKLGILNGEESHEREERESASEGDSRVGGTFPFTGEVTGRFSSRSRDGSEGILRTEPRSHSATQWADSEQPQYSEPGESTGDSIHQADGTSPSECNENEKGDA